MRIHRKINLHFAYNFVFKELTFIIILPGLTLNHWLSYIYIYIYIYKMQVKLRGQEMFYI